MDQVPTAPGPLPPPPTARRGSARWIWILAAVLLLLLLVGLIVMLGQPRPASRSAVFVNLTGTVFGCSHGTACATVAFIGGEVFGDGEARTGAASEADLQTASTAFRLEANATLQFQEVSDSATRLVLALGRLFVSHNAAGQDQITVEAGQERIDALDTRFAVVVDAQGIYVGVPDIPGPGGAPPGSVRVTLYGAQTVIPAGYELRQAPDALLGKPTPISAIERRLWFSLSQWP